MSHPLDRPVWSALNSGWAHLAQGDGRALKLDPAFGPFAANAAGNAEGLFELTPLDGEIWITEAAVLEPPPGLEFVRAAPLAQMVAETIAPLARPEKYVELGDADADEMRALAGLTEPGPFAARTHEFGFVGIRDGGRLVAMAGERMSVPPYREVSGVCAHPNYRGRGLAGALMSVVIERIVSRGETPFLHSYAGNAGAIALYERLGFRIRRELTVTILSRPAASP